jgi:hypothetical protein
MNGASVARIVDPETHALHRDEFLDAALGLIQAKRATLR